MLVRRGHPTLFERVYLSLLKNSGIPVCSSLHLRQVSIFVLQSGWISPRQKVPLTSQHNLPAPYSQAAHLSFQTLGQLQTSQQFLTGDFGVLLIYKRSINCLSTLTGMFRQPCSKLWVAFREIHSKLDSCL
jgi:hypothetical protein